jgi:signal transduction histidine kinase/DNA-binding response OmpR family regulator
MSLYSHQENRYQMHYIAVPATNYMKEDVISMTDAGDNTFWVGTEDNGIYHVSADASHQILENRYPGSAATMVFQDSKGRVWAGLYGKGLYASDGRIFFKGLSPFSMVEDKQGRLFVSLLGQGLWMVEPLTGKTASVYEGALWMMQLAYYEGKVYGISGEYLMAVDTRTLEMEQIPIELFGEDPSIAAGAKTLTIDHRGWLWMVSHRNHAEVHIYDIHKKKAYRVDQLARYVINGIVEDKTGDVWCTTDLGMVRVVVEGEATPSFQLYCYRGGNYGKMPYYNAKALIRLKDGRLLSGASEGYFLIDTNRMPDMLKQTITSESPLITSLRINDQEISPADSVRNISLHSDLIYAKDLVLSYNENNIVLECRPRGFHQLVSSLYYYQLEGESDQWMPMDNYIIRLSNLSPGKYKLKIRRQVYQQDEWEEFDMLSIRIRQPFWNTWQAWLGYLGVIVASFITFLNFFRRRQKYNKKVREMEMQAERDKEMNDMKVRFFTNVSHDLRTPLTLIMTPVEELLNNEQPEPTRKVLEVVNRNAHHLFSLVNQILDFQRLGSTNDVLSLDNADIVELIKKECESYKLMAQQRHIQFNFHTSVDKLPMVLDADKIRKVINNLLSNSFKYTPDGGTICIDIAEGYDGMVQIKESDTGHGIPEADRDHVFERYYVSKARNVTMGSSGLGLNIVKHYVELHGGTVTASDNQPRGALFTILLPMTQKTAVAQSEPITPTGVEGQKERNDAEHRTARLLLVDDNADMLSYMSSVLSADYTIYQATNGLQALEIIRSTEVDLVVSDVMMDGMDGLELTRSIKRDVNISHVPIILLTAKGMAEDELKGLQMGANDYITKPFNFDVLRLRIRQQLEQGVEKRRKFRLNPDIEPSEITITTVDEQLLQQALDAVSKNMENPDFNVDQLASELGMHRTGLNRKLQAITGQTPLVFIRTLRLRRAHQILTADPAKMVSQVAYEVGFNNPKLFSKYFKEEYGCYPSELEASLTENNL